MPEPKIIPLHSLSATDTPDVVLRLSDVTYTRRDEKLLDCVSFDIPSDGMTAILGPNGAGKTLTLRVIAGLIAPDSGRIDMADGLKDNMALVFQTPVLLRRSARANLIHALKIARVPRRLRPRQADELLALADLLDLADRPACALSGGEQQRLSIVRALAREPRVLLLDEPTASLDPRSTAAIERLARRTMRLGTKVIFVTHDWAQAKRLASGVIFLHRGQVTEVTRAPQFFDDPQSRAARCYKLGRLIP